MAVIMKSQKGQQRKKLKGKAKKVFQKCVVDKRLLSSQPESDRTLPASSEHTKTIHPAEVRSEPAGVSGDSDMASTPEASYIDQLPVEPEKSSSEDFDMTSTLQDSCHKPVNKPATQVLLCENQTESSIATPTKLGSKSHQQDQDLFKIKGVSKSPKRMKQKRKVCRKEFFKFYLKNSNSGFHQALKKFHHKKLVQSLKHSPAGGVKSEHRQAVGINDSIQKKAPLKIVVKGRLSSSGVAQSLCPSTIKPPVTPSTPLKMLSRLNVPIHKSTTHSVVSCKVPLESSFEAASPDEDDGTSLNTNENEVSQASKREVCYIFALLDREKDETLFKCSPQVKTSKILQQIATVIDSISADEDLMISKKVYATDHDECLERPSRIDQSTSPIPLPAEPIEEGSQFPPAAEDVPNPSEEESSDDSGMQSDIERKDRMLNATAKVIISKALLSFTSELKVLTDVSIRLLGWCAGTVKADLDSDSFEDEFEGFLCHCHDKVSILIECLHELDLRQILNVDEVEVHRFWLLHDALRCMLQAYRYIQSSSATGHLSQKLLSLLMTCSKTVLPSGSISLTRWVSLMTMISGISRKLCEARLLSNACLCYQHFESLRKGRSCRVCDLQCLFKEVCKTEPLNSKRVNGKSSAACAAKTAVEQLFPRFCLFLSEVEGLSEEEFMTAFKKHSVVKFSCNPQSALYPCDAHLSGIACNCFAVSTDFEEERTVCEGETINGFSDVHNVLNESSVQQIVPLCERDAEEDSPNAQKCSAEAGQNTAPSSNSKVLSGSKVIEVSLENSESSIDSVDTILLQNNGSKSQESDQVVLLNKGSSESSSEDFSLRMPESSNSDPQSSTALCHASEDDTASTDDVQGPSCSMITNPPESPFHRQVSLANLKGRNLNDDSDFDFSVSLSSNCDIDYSHPVFQVAESSIKTALSGNESDSILSVADSQSSAMEPSPEAEFMQDLSVGNDSVFKPSSGVYLKEQTSICPQMGLDSSSMDETHSSQGSEDKHSQKLRSPPPFHVETTLEDTDSSVEMPAFGRVAQGIVSSTQGKNVDLKSSVPLIDHKERANSTHTKETFQIQRMKEDCKRRVLQGLRSLEATRVSPPPEENDLNQRSICTRRQHSSRETGEERGTKTGKTSVANQSTPCQTVSETVLEMGVVDQHVGPEDARNFHSNESVMKKSDKKVTFSDILQFKEFTDSPLLGYGRCKRTHVQERIESLLTELFPLDTGNSDDGGPSTKSRNLEENKDDVADVAPAAVEKDSLKSRKRKLSLQRSKVNPPSDPPKENDQNLKRATRSSTYTNEVSDKQKQNCILDEKFRKTFEKNEGTECIVARKPDSRLKRTMNDLEEDADDELLGNNKKCKNEKKLRTLEPMKSDDAVLQNKMTVDDPKIIKSCLKKTTKTQADTGVLSNINPLQIHKDKFDKTKSGNKDEEESQDVPMQVQPKQAPKSDSGSVSEQKSHQTSRKTTRRMVKEMKEKLYREELKSMTEQTEVIPKSNNDDDQNAEKVKSKKGKKVSISNIWMPGNVEEKSGATNKKTGSKRSKSNLMEDFQRNNNCGQEHCINRDLNVSDADWKMYITDLGKKMLDN